MGTKKRQNKIWEYREMLLAWRKQKVMTWAGYILGFPTDTPQSIARDIEIIKHELPIDVLEFFFLTPLPGSEDHKNLYKRGVAMDPDMNKYDLEHYTTAHARMSREEWEGVYRDAWKRYYTDEHVATIFSRSIASGFKPRKIVDVMTAFAGGNRIEGVHPLQLGIARRKVRTQRRSGMKLESPLIFYPRRVVELGLALVRWLSLMHRYDRMMRRIIKQQAAQAYVDKALIVSADDAAGTSDFVHAYADKIPHTYGAPVQRATAG